jgi:hypothetical protein
LKLPHFIQRTEYSIGHGHKHRACQVEVAPILLEQTWPQAWKKAREPINNTRRKPTSLPKEPVEVIELKGSELSVSSPSQPDGTCRVESVFERFPNNVEPITFV